MALCVCKCLNVTLESDKTEEIVDFAKLELSPVEQRDIFFSEKLLLCPTGNVKIHVAQPDFISQRNIGNWILHSCLVCGQATHATSNNKNGPIHLIPKSNHTTADRINYMKKSDNFSPVFNLLVPEVTNDVEMKENIDTNNYNKLRWPITYQAIGTLKKQLNQTVQVQLEAVDEMVRQFTEQKYAEFEAYKEKAYRDHKILSGIISKAQKSSDLEFRVDQTLDNGPPSPQLPPLQRRRLSSIKDAKKAQSNIKSNRNPPPEEDFSDADILFDLEGTDSHNNMVSDQDDYDSDEGSNDEGIHMVRARGGGHPDIARSLPMKISHFPAERLPHRELDDYEETQDIAASIKALARSVHGDVFELPRPRFSTQI